MPEGDLIVNSMTIGQLARCAGVGVETVRYYERRGLLQEPKRGQSGYRQYDAEAMSRLQFIKRAKDLGFTLREVAELLSLVRDRSASAVDVRSRARDKIADIEARIDSLQRMLKALKALTSACDQHGTVDECPLLDALNDHTNHSGTDRVE